MSVHDKMMEWSMEFRQQKEAEHKERMLEWEHFKTPEYEQELVERLLADTHADTQPPWLEGEEDVGPTVSEGL